MAKKKETKQTIQNGIQKEPVHLREKLLANGNRSLYLDIYRDSKSLHQIRFSYLTILNYLRIMLLILYSYICN